MAAPDIPVEGAEPGLCSAGPASEEIGSFDTERSSGPFFGGSREGIEPTNFSDVHETEIRQELRELCRLQSAGDSASPELDITPGRFIELPAHDDIPERQRH